MARPTKIPASQQTKITVTCSIEQRKEIRMLAAQEDKSMNEFLISLVEERKKRCLLCESYEPNAVTIQTMQETDRGENLERYKDINDFWKSIGRDVDVNSNKHKAV